MFIRDFKIVKDVAWTTMDVLLKIMGKEKIYTKKDLITDQPVLFFLFFEKLSRDWHRQIMFEMYQISKRYHGLKYDKKHTFLLSFFPRNSGNMLLIKETKPNQTKKIALYRL